MLSRERKAHIAKSDYADARAPILNQANNFVLDHVSLGRMDYR